jgi:hypothetical protein
MDLGLGSMSKGTRDEVKGESRPKKLLAPKSRGNYVYLYYRYAGSGTGTRYSHE